MMMVFSRAPHFVSFGLVALLAGCGAKLPERTEKIDLGSAGLAASIEAPTGGRARADGTRTTIEWGSHGEAGTLSLAKREGELRCTGQDADCKVVEQDESSVVKEYTFMKKRKVAGVANVKTGGATLSCDVMAGSVEDVRRLLTACKSTVATGPIASTTTLTAASAAAPKASPPSLQEISVKAADARGPFVYTVRVPEGHTVLESGASRTFGMPKGTPSGSALSVVVSPYSAVSSLAAAEKEATKMDIGGLEPIAVRKELSKTSFLLETAPRGTSRFMTVSVYTAGKKRGGLVRCSGSEAMRSTLEEICSSVKLD